MDVPELTEVPPPPKLKGKLYAMDDLTEAHLAVISMGLDMVISLGTGDLDVIIRGLKAGHLGGGGDIPHIVQERLETSIKTMKNMIGLYGVGHRSVKSPKVSQGVRLAHDLHRLFEKTRTARGTTIQLDSGVGISDHKMPELYVTSLVG